MAPVPYQTAHFHLGRTSCEAALRVVLGRVQTTTVVERFMLLVIPVLLPLEMSDFSFSGTSFMYVIFALLTGYVLLKRLRAVNRIWLQPTFQAGYVFLIVACLIEFSHSDSDYYEIYQTGLMIGGAIVVASLCRDRQALRACMFGYLIAGVWMSIQLSSTSYGTLSGASAVDFDQASRIRGSVAEHLPQGWNLNAVARVAAEGATAALALALSAKSLRRRSVLLGVALFCAVSTFLPMSRGGIVMVGLSWAVLLRAYGINVKNIVLALLLGAVVFMLAPDVVFSRLTFSTEVREGKMEARAQIYTAALERFPDYALTGVGVGNFWKSWAFFNGFAISHQSVVGAHNAFIQTTIYWGVGGLLALLAVLLQGYRCLPKNYVGDEVKLCVLGITTLEFVSLFIGHGLFIKQYSLAMGLLVGARCWIWPHDRVPSPRQQKGTSVLSLTKS